jgi:hypothetical protein
MKMRGVDFEDTEVSGGDEEVNQGEEDCGEGCCTFDFWDGDYCVDEEMMVVVGIHTREGSCELIEEALRQD